MTTLGIGGAAEWFVRVTTPDEVVAAHQWSRTAGVPLMVLGGGSNMVVSDTGVPGLVMAMEILGREFARRGQDTLISVGAGEAWDMLVDEAVKQDLAGIECLSGIPGSVGGTPIQNVGAYGQEVADVIQSVTVFDRLLGETVVLAPEDCAFGYRTSRFKHADATRFIVCRVDFRLRRGVPTVTYPDVVSLLQREGGGALTVADVRRAVLTIRRQKGMVLDDSDSDTRSVGSFFTNPIVPPAVHARIASSVSGRVPGFPSATGQVKMSAAWLIEGAGLSRGYSVGRVGLSSKHPLAIVNRGGATAREVLEFAALIKRAVVERFGVWLTPEPVFVGLADESLVVYLKKGVE